MSKSKFKRGKLIELKPRSEGMSKSLVEQYNKQVQHDARIALMMVLDTLKLDSELVIRRQDANALFAQGYDLELKGDAECISVKLIKE